MLAQYVDLRCLLAALERQQAEAEQRLQHATERLEGREEMVSILEARLEAKDAALEAMQQQQAQHEQLLKAGNPDALRHPIPWCGPVAGVQTRPSPAGACES